MSGSDPLFGRQKTPSTPKVTATPPPPTAQDQAVERAKRDIKARRKRAFGRRDTRITTGSGRDEPGVLKQTQG